MKHRAHTRQGTIRVGRIIAARAHLRKLLPRVPIYSASRGSIRVAAVGGMVEREVSGQSQGKSMSHFPVKELRRYSLLLRCPGGFKVITNQRRRSSTSVTKNQAARLQVGC